VGWTVEKFVTVPHGRANGHKPSSPKAQEDSGKKNSRVKASANGKANTPPRKSKGAVKKSAAKGKSATKKSPSKGKTAKPAKKAPSKMRKTKGKK